jgi:hypothetical protein
MKKISAESAGNFSIKVWLQKVKQIRIRLTRKFTTKAGLRNPFFHQGLIENVKSKSDENFSIRV